MPELTNFRKGQKYPPTRRFLRNGILKKATKDATVRNTKAEIEEIREAEKIRNEEHICNRLEIIPIFQVRTDPKRYPFKVGAQTPTCKGDKH